MDVSLAVTATVAPAVAAGASCSRGNCTCCSYSQSNSGSNRRRWYSERTLGAACQKELQHFGNMAGYSGRHSEYLQSLAPPVLLACFASGHRSVHTPSSDEIHVEFRRLFHRLVWPPGGLDWVSAFDALVTQLARFLHCVVTTSSMYKACRAMRLP